MADTTTLHNLLDDVIGQTICGVEFRDNKVDFRDNSIVHIRLKNGVTLIVNELKEITQK